MKRWMRVGVVLAVLMAGCGGGGGGGDDGELNLNGHFGTADTQCSSTEGRFTVQERTGDIIHEGSNLTSINDQTGGVSFGMLTGNVATFAETFSVEGVACESTTICNIARNPLGGMCEERTFCDDGFRATCTFDLI